MSPLVARAAVGATFLPMGGKQRLSTKTKSKPTKSHTPLLDAENLDAIAPVGGS